MKNPFESIEARLSSIEDLILDLKHYPKKQKPALYDEVWLDLNDLIKYDPEKRTKPTWYSKISRNEVPYYKRGKKVYFLKSEIDEWLRQGKCKSNSEIEEESSSYLLRNKKG